YSTRYSERVVRMLIDRKGVHRAPLYFDFKETRGRHFLGPLFRYLRARRAQDLAVLEVGCSFGHVTEYLAEQPEIATIHAFDTDPAFVAITRAKVEELGLKTVRSVARLSNEETRRLPWADGVFDVVLAVGVVEHLPAHHRRAQVDEYYRVLAPDGHIAILDTPNRWFPLETHSVGLPLVQWLPPRLAHRYGRMFRRRKFGAVPYEEVVADGTGWRNATLAECLPSSGWHGLRDVPDVAFLSETSRTKLETINQLFNETAYSGEGASNYDQIHRYAEAEQHEHPCRTLIEEVWAPEGYGRALDLGAGSGYFTTMIARRAT